MTPKPTLRQQLIEALHDLGCPEIPGASRVWLVFSHDLCPGKKFFLGKTGSAFRVGTSIPDSVAAYRDKLRLLQLWQQDHAPNAIILKKVSNL